ncbi:hypothetical protein BN1708_002005 [Verticillium longisporum]|uniref:Uncharacterized protein n=1 Tax=Verticillium longisporum TaxID=100787 RepID=A0A0G4KI31_VERLO|nr:hypothetical protein BN1708_002005 [Verticillium longisporum]
MSRALEKEVVAFLKSGNHTAVYEDISRALVPPDDPTNDPAGLLEIEILGRSHPTPPGQNLLQDKNAIGIPKLRLVQAFLVAHQIARAHTKTTEQVKNDILSATTVMLLMDAENLTAANTRKRILLSRIKRLENGRISSLQPQDCQMLLYQESWFVDSLLTSRLHRHTKSPTLWSHRRWLVEQHRNFGHAVDIRAGFNIVKTAGERHPRNYYAWCHARWLLKISRHVLTKEDILSLENSIEIWSLAHHDDISGWSMLAHIQEMRGDNVARLNVFRNLLDTAESYRWTNESVWWYLRTTAATLDLQIEDLDHFKTTQQKLSNEPDNNGDHASTSHRVLETAWQWYNQNRGKANSGTIGG